MYRYLAKVLEVAPRGGRRGGPELITFELTVEPEALVAPELAPSRAIPRRRAVVRREAPAGTYRAGGRVVLDHDTSADTLGVALIRQHMRDIAVAFEAGDFTKPFQVHAEAVPGTSVMAARRGGISYQEIDRPRGAEVRIRTSDAAAVAAIHEFLAFQRDAHHAMGHERQMRHVH